MSSHVSHTHHSLIYRNRWHLFATLIIIVAPFLFLLVFSRLLNIASERLFNDIGVSFVRLLIAYIIAAVLGWILAATFSRGRRAVIALPAFDILQSFPTFATLPLATVVFGTSTLTVIVFLILTVIWPIIFSILSSLRLIKREYNEAVQIYGLRGWDYIRLFVWPASIPGLITGSMIGLGEGWEALIATEIIVAAKPGLGSFFREYSTNPTITWFGILGFLIIIFSLNRLVWAPLTDWAHDRIDE